MIIIIIIMMLVMIIMIIDANFVQTIPILVGFEKMLSENLDNLI